MKARHLRTLAIAALALLGVAGSAVAQTSSAMLNTLEVRQLVARAEPGDHARLGAHFAALADEYTLEAERHTAMSTGMAGNPNRRAAAGPNAHCARLAELNTQAAATLRELAAHHERLAAGVPSTVPQDSARFESGEGAPEPTDTELAALEAMARIPADHRALEEYFLTLASRYTAEAKEHGAMAQAYRGNANRRGGDPAVHCDRMVKLSRESATEARAVAAEHAQLAGLR